MLIVLASGKGGVAKSTSAIAISAALRELGLDPVLLDLDSGGDLTWSLGFEPADAALDVLRGRRSLLESVAVSPEGLRVVAASPGLLWLEGRPVAEIATKLRDIAKTQLVIVDTPPGFAPIGTRAAISAAGIVVVPFVPEPTAERRARHVLDIAAVLEADPKIFGLGVMVDGRRALTAAILDDARDGGLAPIALVPRAVVVPESSNAARSVIAHAPRSPAAEAYRTAAKRLYNEIRKSERSK